MNEDLSGNSRLNSDQPYNPKISPENILYLVTKICVIMGGYVAFRVSIHEQFEDTSHMFSIDELPICL